MSKTLDEHMKIIKWARKRGACLIKVGDIELTFPPDVRPVLTSIPRPIATISSEAAKAEEFIRNPTALDDPDYYAQEQDAWATHSRPPPLR